MLNRTIYRLDSRKMYDYVRREYINLDEIGTIIASGENVTIRNLREEDITNLIFLRLLEKRPKKINKGILAELIRKAYS